MSVISRRVLTDEIRSWLATATGRPVRVGKPNQADTPPFAIVYPITGTYDGPPLIAPNADAMVVYQITSVGRRPDQAEFMADKVRQAWLSRDGNGVFAVAFAPPGYRIVDRFSDIGPGNLDREGSLWSVPERFGLAITES